jgi:hypothetical protein
MSSPAIISAILASGAILLAFIGGMVGNILTVYAIRFKTGKSQNVNRKQKIAIVFYLATLILILGTFLYYLVLNLFVNSTDLLLMSAGILFGILGSILMNFFSHYFDCHIDSMIEDKRWLNKDGKEMLILGFPLVLFFIYLSSLFVYFAFFAK